VLAETEKNQSKNWTCEDSHESGQGAYKRVISKVLEKKFRGVKPKKKNRQTGETKHSRGKKSGKGKSGEKMGRP